MQQNKKNFIISIIGNALEWYDFAVYGFFAYIIGKQFFPNADPLVSLISSYGVFASGYLMRPLGGIIFGHIGDKYGRKIALQISIIIMAIPTTLTGLLPNYNQVGIFAPILLVLIRLAQGMSVGGEFIGSISYITEIAPKKKKGFYGSWTVFTVGSGLTVGSLIASLMHYICETNFLNVWGWRIPFLFGIVIGVVGLWMRKGLIETPEFDKLKELNHINKNPILNVIKTSFKDILMVLALVMVFGSSLYMVFIWWPTYLTKIVKPPISSAFMINTISMLIFMACCLISGWLSDIFGQKKILSLAMLAIILFTYPLFYLTDLSILPFTILAQIIFAIIIGFIQGPMPALLSSIFTTNKRYSGIAIGYNTSLTIFGGTTPLVATLLIHKTSYIAAPAFYLILLGIISFIAICFYKPAKNLS